MRRRLLRTTLIVGAVALLATTGTVVASAKHQAAGEYKVGIVYSRTGLLAAYGGEYIQGLRLGIQYATQGIRVNAVCPGAIDTPMMEETFARFPGFREMLLGLVPMQRMGRPDEVAQAIAWLTSEGASFVTGAGITIEGGLLAR